MRRLTLTWLALIGALSTQACGGAPIPQQKITDTEAAIRAAEVGGAPGVPEAALHLKRANEQLAQAKRMVSNGDNERAAWVLRRAEVDAELALAMAQEQTARNEAKKAMDEVAKLREKLGSQS